METKKDTPTELYRARIRKVQAHIEANLDTLPTLEQLATIAGFSAFYFHRIFHAFVGEPVAAHHRRLRLERAATQLTTSRRNVLSIALDAGFESEAAFSKAFKARFHISPGAYRKHAPNSKTANESSPMKTHKIDPQEITTIDPIDIYYARKTGPYKEAAQAAFSTLMPFLYGNRLMRPESRCFGISWDNPKVTEAERIRFDAAASVDVEHPLKGEVQRRKLNGGRYAIFLHKGPYEGLQQTYTNIFSAWLPESGEDLRDLPPFEEYLNRDPRRTKPENLRTLIYIPLN